MAATKTKATENVIEDEQAVEEIYPAVRIKYENGHVVDVETGEILGYSEQMDPEMKETIHGLSVEFDASVVGTKDKYDYISHALVTERLNQVCPDWSFEILREHSVTDSKGMLHCVGVTVALTINGVTRMEVGGPQRMETRLVPYMLEVKNAVSDALKRAAMRFGVALYLWDNLVDAIHDDDIHPDRLNEPTERAAPAAASAPARAPQTRQAAPAATARPNAAPARAQARQQAPQAYPYDQTQWPNTTTTADIIAFMEENSIEVNGYQGREPNMADAIYAAKKYGKETHKIDNIVIGTGEMTTYNNITAPKVRPMDIGNALTHWFAVETAANAATKNDVIEEDEVPF